MNNFNYYGMRTNNDIDSKYGSSRALKQYQLNDNRIGHHRPSQHQQHIGNYNEIQIKQQKQEIVQNKKKLLRLDSSYKLAASRVKVRSLSNFSLSTISTKNNLPQSLPFSDQKSDTKPDYQAVQHRKALNYEPQSIKNCPNVLTSQKIVKQASLDWGTNPRKKMRRLTGLSDIEKISTQQQSTIDQKTDNHEYYYQTCKMEFKNTKSTVNKNSKLPHKQNIYAWIDQHIPNEQKKLKTLQKSDFQIGKKLGSGNFSTAYLAIHKKTGFICALKIMSKKKIKQQKYENQISRQITIQSYLNHHNVVQLYGMFDDRQNIYLILEYCTDGHLYGLIRHNSRLDQEKTSDIVRGISLGIQYTHKEMVIHRDLKPENIFMNFGIAKIGDFGWAVYMGANGQLRKTVSGSPLYFSPEIVQRQNYDEKIDIWGVGTITYQCLIGMTPFKVYSVMNLNRIVVDSLNFPSYVDISQRAIDFIQKCLKKRPQQRWSIEQVLKHSFIKSCAQ